MSVPTRKLPGTSYAIQLQAHPTSKSGKIGLVKGKWPVAEKVCPALDSKTVISILEDIIDSEGLGLNPKLIERIVAELLEELGEAPKVPAVTKKPSELIEIEEEVSPVAVVQPTPEVPVTPPLREEIPPPAPPLAPPTPIKRPTLPKGTLDDIQTLKMQITELQNLVKTVSKKFEGLTILVEKIGVQTKQ